MATTLTYDDLTVLGKCIVDETINEMNANPNAPEFLKTPESVKHFKYYGSLMIEQDIQPIETLTTPSHTEFVYKAPVMHCIEKNPGTVLPLTRSSVIR